MARKRLGEMLLERGIIDQDQLSSALAYQRQWGHRLGVALVAKGFVSEGALTSMLSENLGIPIVDLSTTNIDKEALRLLNVQLCETHVLIPITVIEEGNRRYLKVAMSDPLNLNAIEEIEFTTGMTVRPVLAQISSINQAVRRYYRGERVDIAPVRLDQEAEDDGDEMVIVRGGQVDVVPGGGSLTPDAVILGEETSSGPIPMNDIEAARRLGRSASAPLPQIDIERIDALEKKFWVMMRILARKGLIAKEEYLRELKRAE